MFLMRVSVLSGLSVISLLVTVGAAEADDLESKVKYSQMRTHWKIEEGRRKIEADRARMQQDRENRARHSKLNSVSTVSSYGSASTSSSAKTDYTQPAGNGLNWYTNKPHSFRSLFMGQPKVSSSAGPLGTTCNIFAYSNNQGATMISVTELPVTPTDQASINRCLNGAVDGSIKSGSGVETGRYSSSLQGHPGREFSANIPEKKGKMKSKLYLANKRLYQVLVVGENSFVDSSYAQQFIKSFSFL